MFRRVIDIIDTAGNPTQELSQTERPAYTEFVTQLRNVYKHWQSTSRLNTVAVTISYGVLAVSTDVPTFPNTCSLFIRKLKPAPQSMSSLTAICRARSGHNLCLLTPANYFNYLAKVDLSQSSIM